MDSKTNFSKHNRMMDLCTRLMDGEVVKKEEAVTRYEVNSRTFMRDIDDLRSFFATKPPRMVRNVS